MSAVETYNQDGQQSRVKYNQLCYYVRFVNENWLRRNQYVYERRLYNANQAFACWQLRDFSNQCERTYNTG